MRPARSRRVQAQRKFAQGAYMPPAAVAVVTTDTRQNTVQDPNVTINHVSATSLLDTVAMEGLHTHLQPVVLLERLRGRKPSSDAPPSPAPPSPAPPICAPPPPASPALPVLPRTKLNIMVKIKHTMSLRTRRKPTNKYRDSEKFVVPHNSGKRRTTKRRLTNPTSKSSHSKKSRGEPSEFSLEDNQPLTIYFGKCNSKAKAEAPVQGAAQQPAQDQMLQAAQEPVQAPMLEAAQEPPPNPMDESMQPVQEPEQDLMQEALQQPVHELVQQPVEEPVQQLAPEPVQQLAPEPVQQPAQEPVQQPAQAPVWALDDINRQNRSDNVLEGAVPVQSEGGVPVPCIAQKWRSVQGVINATKEELDSRCKQCAPCVRIDKLMKLSELLHTQLDLPNGSHTNANDDKNDEAMVSPDADQGHLYLDLLPKHPNVVMKINTHIVHGKELMSACLIPRNESKTNKQEFVLEEQEHLLDQLIETLSLNNKTDNRVTRRASVSSIVSITDDSDDAESLSRETEDQLTVQRKKKRQQRPAKKRNNNLRARVQQQKLKDLLRIEAKGTSLARGKTRVQEQVDESDSDSDDDEATLEQLTPQVPESVTPQEEGLEVGTSSDANATGTGASPQTPEGGGIVDAPIFRPTKEEFNDPIEYFEKIWPEAAKFGICKVVPPEGWNPTCRITDDLRFDVSNQYIPRLLNRWGPAARELSAIKLCLYQQRIKLVRPAVLDGVEVNLPKLYHTIQKHGGLENVMNKKRWTKVSDEMRLPKHPILDKKLDNMYVKYLLPYDTLTSQERQEILGKVERGWNKKNQKLLERAMNPLHRQKRMLGLSDSSDDDSEDEETALAISEAEDCIMKGAVMNPPRFKRVARHMYENILGPGAEANGPPSLEEIEEKYWRYVTQGTEHLCVYTAAIDTGEQGHGFTKNKNEPFGKHPWNLKMISQNPRNILRYLGPVLGVTVPTLHLSMLFSTSCWHKDPHTLPWQEYQHSGPTRIWYGIANEQTDRFRMAVETVCPTYAQNKGLWLSTDITMIPPNVLREQNVCLSRVTQAAGEFIVAFPRAYTCCISTGYTESESVYFAPVSWLANIHEAFQEARESCEPTMFSMEQLLYQIGKDPRTERDVLAILQPIYDKMLRDEVTNRQMLQERGIAFVNQNSTSSKRKRSGLAFNSREHDECDYCRATLFLSKVKGLTGRNESLCLEHALKLMDVGRYSLRDISQSEVHVLVTVKELNTVGDDIKRRLQNIKRL
ncbi:protein Jumonji isoform X2 [Helicoverpa armigera]|uniref:protein Jumonji isoform X2 n=1 Tax=Helicoverpa armigera TaxID=29058 RepID=UPI003082714D